MPLADFIHLRVHTAYSLSAGAIKIKELVGLCKANKMPAVAITDSGNLFGALEFATACAAEGVQPIIGCEVALATHEAGERQPTQRDLERVVLLVQSEVGYRNLLALVTRSFLDSDAGADPAITPTDLAINSEGLLCLAGGAKGPLGRLLADGQDAAACLLLDALKDTFPGRLYIELTRHGMAEEARTENGLVDLAYRHDLPLVATNDAYFPNRDYYEAHDALLCIAEGKAVDDNDRAHLTPDHFFRPAAEMRALFADLPEACDNTLVIAQRCAFMPTLQAPILPAFPMPEGLDEAGALRESALAGLETRLAAAPPGTDPEPYRQRLEFELGTIIQMGFAGYFLIVADFIQWAKRQGIPVGPGRGSGAGSVVAWSLTITDLDPLRFSLLFERFLNPERVSMPDFDIDFCQDRRDEVIRYVQEKYGRDRVAQIITFGKLQARAVLRDVGRVLGMPYGQVDKLCKLVPNNPANPITLDKAIAAEPVLQQARDSDEQVARLMRIALKLEGLYRHASTHAAGVVIGDRPLAELVPLYRDPRSDMPATQFNMKWVEPAGLVKFDFLGLKTLTVLARCNELLAARGVDLDLTNLPLDDPKTFDLLTRADTVGVFQVEGAGVRDMLKKLRPDRFEDIIAVVSLYRPGPMENIPRYISVKHGQEQPDYLHPQLEGILKETHGIMIYQEQVMQIAQVLAGYTLGGADLLRRAMGKKKAEEMEQQKGIFIDGSLKNGHSDADAARVFDLMAYFAGYGFNKSHSAAYALITYQTAFLKAHFPVEFMCATLSADKDKTEKVVRTVAEARTMGLTVLPPDINESEIDFSVVYQPNPELKAARAGRPACSGGSLSDVTGPKIRFGLGGVKGIGEAALEAIFEARREEDGSTKPFGDLFDFSGRVDLRRLNKGVLEALVQCGAFDRLHGPRSVHRAQAFGSIDTAIERGKKIQSERASGQQDLFGLLTEAEKKESNVDRVEFIKLDAWDTRELLSRERGALGFYVSGHPLDAYGAEVSRFCTATVAGLSELPAEARVEVAGLVEGLRERPTKAGGKMAFFSLEDATDRVEVIVRPKFLENAREILNAGEPVLVSGQVQFEGERNAQGGEDEEAAALTTKLLLTDVRPLSVYLATKAKAMRVSLEIDKLADQALLTLKRTLLGHPGNTPVQLELRGPDFRVQLKGEGLYVTPSDLLMLQLTRLFGGKVAELV